ncbi:MAG: AraC family transcriptional regulator [Reinekea sp.]|nr:AraC family transcriptional regulator [Reinekea sp.]MDX1475088.1 AraC family transcriptional regulator [Reinekea sp.]
MKPYIEQVSRERHFNWRLKAMNYPQSRFDWHYHLEYEIVLLRHSHGQLFAGNYSGDFHHNTLAMFGPHLPHTSYMESRGQFDQNNAYVLWFSAGWINRILTVMPELSVLETLLADARHGLLFDTHTAEAVNALIENFDDLDISLQSHRFLEVLIVMANAQRQRLNKYGPLALVVDSKDQDRVAHIAQFIDEHYHEQITIEQMAAQLHTSKSSLQRLFSKHYRESFSEHLKQYRIGKACELLINTERPIALISESVGFLNLSNFNRQFRQCKAMTPREFRQRYVNAQALSDQALRARA